MTACAARRPSSDHSAGDVTCFAGSAADCQVDVADELSGPDGLAFDVDANLYIASGKNDRLLRVSADGEVEVLWSGWPLAWPTVLTFGATPDTASTLYASNIDIARLYGTPSEPTSAIVGYDVGVEGR